MSGATASRPMANTAMIPITANKVIPLSGLAVLLIAIVINVLLHLLLQLFPFLVRDVRVGLLPNAVRDTGNLAGRRNGRIVVRDARYVRVGTPARRCAAGK